MCHDISYLARAVSWYIYIAVLTCDFRRNDKTLEGVATFMKMKKKSPGNRVPVSEGALVAS